MSAPRQISFVIPGRIGGKGRHRSFIRAGKIASYTPPKTQSDEGVVRHFAKAAMKGQKLMVGALYLRVAVFRIPPVSWSAKKKSAAKFITGKPDADNVIKLLSDAMNRIVYADDAQIAAIDFMRSYNSGTEQISVVIQELDNL